MKTVASKVWSFIKLLFNYLIGKRPSAPVEPELPEKYYPSFPPTEFELQLVIEINKYRVANGVKELKYHQRLSDVCRSHSEYLCSINDGNHDNFKERAANFPKNSIKENVAVGFSTPSSTVNAWSRSEGHRLAMVNQFMVNLGVSMVENANGKKFVTSLLMN